MLGYKIDKAHFSYYVKGGVNLQFLLNAQGQTISASKNSLITDLKTEVPFLKFHFDWLASAGIAFHVTEQASLFFEPWYSMSNGSVINSNYPIGLKYGMWGAKVGVSWKL